VVKDVSQTVMLPADQADGVTLERLFVPLCERAKASLAAEGLSERDMALLPALDMRYVGQSYELRVEIELAGGQHARTHIEAFHAAHRQRFSYASEEEPVEIVNLRLKAVGRTAKPRFLEQMHAGLHPKAAHLGHKQVYFADAGARAARPLPSALYDRGRLAPGNIVVGPAVVFQLDTTTTIPPGWAATVDGWQNLVVERT
jgi:N-methylhydantoinase A